jgi:hypothetical protein
MCNVWKYVVNVNNIYYIIFTEEKLIFHTETHKKPLHKHAGIMPHTVSELSML